MSESASNDGSLYYDENDEPIEFTEPAVTVDGPASPSYSTLGDGVVEYSALTPSITFQ